MILRIISLLGATGLLTACGTTSHRPVSRQTHATQPTQVGFAVHLPLRPQTMRLLERASKAGATSIRVDFAWSAIEPRKGTWHWQAADTAIASAARANLSVLALAAYSPTWASSEPSTDKAPPKHAADYARFVRALADRYRNGGIFWRTHKSLPLTPLTGIEIWNEENANAFWRHPSGNEYAALLNQAYVAIKSVAPSTTVALGGLAPRSQAEDIDPVQFLEQAYNNSPDLRFDALAIHPYSFYLPNPTSYEPRSLWSEMAQTHPNLRSVMESHGDGAKQIWVTEYGLPSSGGPANYFNPARQAKWARQALWAWHSFPWAGNFYWYDLVDDCADPANPQCSFGALTATGQRKPVFSALAATFHQRTENHVRRH